MNDSIDTDGFAMVPTVLSPAEQERLLSALGEVIGAGKRRLLSLPIVSELAHSSIILDLVRPHLIDEPRPVRAIYFDKSSDANWLVPWHQDLTLAVKARVGTPGFGPWSQKDGIPHVQPPVELLQQMVTVRLHLDPADESNGALRVLPSSHRLGRLSAARVQELRDPQREVLCGASAGDVLLMRPLLLHASSRSTSPQHRRILHIEYAGFRLPEGLDWHEAA